MIREKYKDLSKVISLLVGILVINTLVGLVIVIDYRTSTQAHKTAIKTEQIRQRQLAEDAEHRGEERKISLSFQSLVSEVSRTQERFLTLVIMAEQEAAKDTERSKRHKEFIEKLQGIVKQMHEINGLVLDKVNLTSENKNENENETLPH